MPHSPVTGMPTPPLSTSRSGSARPAFALRASAGKPIALGASPGKPFALRASAGTPFPLGTSPPTPLGPVAVRGGSGGRFRTLTS